MISYKISVGNEIDWLKVAHIALAEIVRTIHILVGDSNLVRAITVLLCLAVGWFALSINIGNGNNNDDDNNESI